MKFGNCWRLKLIKNWSKIDKCSTPNDPYSCWLLILCLCWMLGLHKSWLGMLHCSIILLWTVRAASLDHVFYRNSQIQKNLWSYGRIWFGVYSLGPTDQMTEPIWLPTCFLTNSLPAEFTENVACLFFIVQHCNPVVFHVKNLWVLDMHPLSDCNFQGIQTFYWMFCYITMLIGCQEWS